MVAEEYLGRSRLFRRLKSGPHGQVVELYAVRLVRDGLARQGTWRCLSLVGDLLSCMARSRAKLTDLDERMVERHLRHRARKQSIQPGDRAALKRLLSVLREAGTIAPVALPPMTPQDQIFREFDDYLRRERGLAPKSIIRHLPVIRRFLREVCPAGAGDLGKISPEDVTRYIERHARDWSTGSGKAMCWVLRAFLRYLHHRGLNPLALAGCEAALAKLKPYERGKRTRFRPPDRLLAFLEALCVARLCRMELGQYPLDGQQVRALTGLLREPLGIVRRAA